MWTLLKTSKERWASFWNLYQRKTCLVVYITVNQTNDRRWQTKLVNTRKVPLVHFLHQKSVKGMSDYVWRKFHVSKPKPAPTFSFWSGSQGSLVLLLSMLWWWSACLAILYGDIRDICSWGSVIFVLGTCGNNGFAGIEEYRINIYVENV